MTGFIILFVFIGIVGGMGFMVYRTLKKTDQSMTGVAIDPSNIKTAQELLPFDDIENKMIDLGGFKYRMIVECTSVNYGLKTGQEKEMIEVAFQRFLNSLQFPITLYVQTKEIDNSKMLSSLEESVEEIVQIYPQLEEYARDYVGEMKELTTTIQNSKQKKKYIIVPYDEASLLTGLSNEEKYEYSLKELYSRSQMVAESLSSVGIKGTILPTADLIELIYSIYHKDDYSNVENLTSGEYLALTVEGSFEEEKIVNGKVVTTMKKGNRLQNLSDFEKATGALYQAQNLIKTEILAKALTDEDDTVFGAVVERLQEIRDMIEKLESERTPTQKEA